MIRPAFRRVKQEVGDTVVLIHYWTHEQDTCEGGASEHCGASIEWSLITTRVKNGTGLAVTVSCVRSSTILPTIRWLEVVFSWAFDCELIDVSASQPPICASLHGPDC